MILAVLALVELLEGQLLWKQVGSAGERELEVQVRLVAEEQP